MILEEETYKKFGYYPSDLPVSSHKRIIVKCDNCDKVREIAKGAYRALCKSCAFHYAKLEAKNPNWKGGKVECICRICGKRFKSNIGRIKKGQSLYCSKSCAAKSRTGENSPTIKPKIKCICQSCGKEFELQPCRIKETWGKFCSLSCARKNQKGAKNPQWKGGKTKQKCPICGKIFEVYPLEIKRGHHNYCSLICARKARKSFPQHHTKPELIFEQICKKHNLPFKYTGDNAFWIGKNPSVNPDFIHLTKKIAVEIFSYWHDPLKRHCKVPYSATYEGRKRILKKHGWRLVVFWQEDLERKDAEQFVLSTLESFI